MQIELSQAQYDLLSARAAASGYADVESLIRAIADEPYADPRGEQSESALRVSASELADADAAIERGEGVDADAALSQIAARHGLKID
ncbi:MAG: hypothetical protein AAF805_04420 [Planctomycetota bacterium]